MAVNRIVLEQDGLVVGSNQLVASGNGIYIGNNLVVSGNIYNNTIFDLIFDPVITTSNNVITNSGGYITYYKDNLVEYSNIVYNSNNYVVSYTERALATNLSRNYTVTYYANNIINSVTRA